MRWICKCKSYSQMKLEDELSLQRKADAQKIKMEVELEDALDLAGAGRYQFIHCTLMVLTLAASILEIIGSSYILPAAACDLELSDSLRGVVTSIPNMGVIMTAPFWGYAADKFGRKPVIMISTGAAGVLGLAASMTPNLLGFAMCKLAASLFLASPSSLSFAYAGEFMPRKRRDFAILISNAFLMFATAMSSVLAWSILSFDWHNSKIRPWRVLTAVYAFPLIITAICLTQAKESPKFLMTKGKDQEALDVLRHVYAANSGKEKDSFGVKSLKKTVEVEAMTGLPGGESKGKLDSTSALALFRPPHLKWFALNSFLMFGLFSLLNGLFLFAPSTINKMFTESSDKPITICEIMNQVDNHTASPACVDSISHGTFQITVVTALVYSALVMIISFVPLSKKTLLVGMFTTVGLTCLISVLSRNKMLAGVSMSALQVTGLGIGPLTAYAVQLFPTCFRATAVGAVIMFGRVGSVVGANASGIFLAGACTATFYGFAALLFLCAVLSFLLPSDKSGRNR